jgi:predicted transcriptional regulator
MPVEAVEKESPTVIMRRRRILDLAQWLKARISAGVKTTYYEAVGYVSSKHWLNTRTARDYVDQLLFNGIITTDDEGNLSIVEEKYNEFMKEVEAWRARGKI